MHAALLAGCVERWAAELLRGHRVGEPYPELLYVHAWTGGGAPGEVGTAAAVEALRAMDRACAAWRRERRALRISALVLEDDPALVERLAGALRGAGFGGRLHAEAGPESLPPGAVVLRTADPAEALRSAWRPAAGRAFVSLAPPRPERAPAPLLRELLAPGGTEVLLRVPTAGLGTPAPAAIPLADLPPYARRSAEGWAALLDISPATWLAEWRAAADPAVALVERLASGLAAADAGAKRISLVAGETGPRVHCFLLGADPARALAANRLPDELAQGDVTVWAARRFVLPPQPAPAEPLELWGAHPSPSVSRPPARRLDGAALAAALQALRGRSEPEVLREFLGSDLLPDELRRALRRLRGGARSPRGAAEPAPSLWGPERG